MSNFQDRTEKKLLQVRFNDLSQRLEIGGVIGQNARDPFRIMIAIKGMHKGGIEDSVDQTKALDVCAESISGQTSSVDSLIISFFHGDHGSVTFDLKKNQDKFVGEIIATRYSNSAENEILHEQCSVVMPISFSKEQLEQALGDLKDTNEDNFEDFLSKCITSIEKQEHGFLELANPFTIRVPLDPNFRLGLNISEFSDELLLSTAALSNARDSLTGFKTKKDFDSPGYRDSITGIGGVIFISGDIVGMKYANQYFSPDKVDAYIKEISKAALNVFGDENCFRFGGDEFVFVLPLNRYNTSIKLLSIFRLHAKEISEQFYDGLLKEAKEGALYDYEIKWALDRLAGRYRSTKVNETSDDAEKSLESIPLNYRLNTDEFIEFLHTESPDTYYLPTMEEKWLYAAEELLKSGDRPNSRPLDLYLAPVRINQVVSAEDPLQAIVTGDRLIQSAKSKEINLGDEEVFGVNIDERQIRFSTIREFHTSVTIQRQIRETAELLNSDHISEKLYAAYRLILKRAEDSSLGGLVCRSDLLKGVPASIALGITEPKDFTFIRLELPGFGILNKVEGTNRADQFFLDQLSKIAPHLGRFFGHRSGGIIHLVVADKMETIAPILVEAKDLMDLATDMGSRHPLAKFERAKRGSMDISRKRKDGLLNFDDISESIGGPAFRINLSLGRISVNPMQDLSTIGTQGVDYISIVSRSEISRAIVELRSNR